MHMNLFKHTEGKETNGEKAEQVSSQSSVSAGIVWKHWGAAGLCFKLQVNSYDSENELPSEAFFTLKKHEQGKTCCGSPQWRFDGQRQTQTEVKLCLFCLKQNKTDIMWVWEEI